MYVHTYLKNIKYPLSSIFLNRSFIVSQNISCQWRALTHSIINKNSAHHSKLCALQYRLTWNKPCHGISYSCSTYSPSRLPKINSVIGIAKMDFEEFTQVFPQIVSDLTKDFANCSDLVEAAAKYKEVLEYNVAGGKKTRGVFVVKCYKDLVDTDMLKDEDIFLAQIAGWCVELLQAFFLIADDIMDQSTTRRGKLCWYKKTEVGLDAVNDAVSVECGVYVLLKKYFRTKPYYVNLLELFHRTTMQTSFGQSLDAMFSGTKDNLDFTKYTATNYDAVVKYKTAYYSFYLPVAIALYMAGITDDQLHSKVKSVLLRMGHLFQVQDDYLDCFGDPAVTGKIGTDIEDGKCTWLVVSALEQGTSKQIDILKENYGINELSNVLKVKSLYESLGLPDKFKCFEKEVYQEVLVSITRLEGAVPTGIFFELLNAIYQRKS